MAKAPPDFEAAEQALRWDRSLRYPQLLRAAELLESGRIAAAVKRLREFLDTHPLDVGALRLMAEAARRSDRHDEAEALLAKCVEIAPASMAARYGFAQALLKNKEFKAALSETELILKREPRNPFFRSLRAGGLEAIGDYAGAALVWRELLDDYPDKPKFWLRYGHILRGLGEQDACIVAYRNATTAETGFGTAYWCLASLKTHRFSDADIERMEALCAKGDCSPEDRTQLHFSLGRAYAERRLYEKSFGHYARGNAIHRTGMQHDPDVRTDYVVRCKALLSEDFFRARSGSGCESSEPIFLVGTIRAGSTLVEQILASHPQIEGTTELFETAALINRIETEGAQRGTPRLPEALTDLDPVTLRDFGRWYLESARLHKKTARPHFTDKMGGNYAHLAMLHLILPNAKIVDVRRHPLACGFSIFSELFATGQNYAYRLADIGRAYRDYVELMAHFDRVLTGKVHRVFYERLVEQPETEIRRLLDYLQLPFDPACLEFYKTDRIVTTISSEQVRNPIYRDAVEQWRHYEPWLGPLKSALGPVLDSYPDVPEFGAGNR